jgi:hypothetical protein
MHERFAGGNAALAHRQVRDEGCAWLQVAGASTSVRLAVRPDGKHGEEDTEADHHQQGERCNHRSEECKRLRHRGSPLRSFARGECAR